MSLFVELEIWRPGLSREAVWPELLFLITALTATLMDMARQLPWQNVLGAVALVGALSAGAQWTAIALGTSLGPNSGLGICERTVVFTVILLNARGVARLVLRRWSGGANYGFWVLGISVGLAMLLGVGYAWKTAAMDISWRAWALGAASNSAILVSVTPLLINKRPVKERADFHPLAFWVVLSILGASVALKNGSVLAVAIILFQLVVVTLIAAVGESRSRSAA